MAQIKKKFIQDGAVDGEKLLLLNNQAVKAKDAAGQDQELFKLDTAGVLKLLKLPVLPSETPAGDYQVASKKFVDDSVAGEASLRESAISAEAAARTKADNALSDRLDILEADETTKAYVDSQISAEASERAKEDGLLQGQIDTEKGRIDAILLASDADKDSFAEIVQLINSIDSSNDKSFAAYVLSNDAALAQEVSDRQDADSALDARLLVLELDPTSKAYVDAAIATEQQTRDDEIVAVEGRLEILEGDNNVSGSVASIVYNESVERSQADNNLQNQITANRTEALQHADELVLNEFNRAFEAETDIRDRLDIIEGMDTLEGSVAKAKKDAKDYADGIVASEAATRSKADTDLQGQIDTEKGRIDAILLASDADKDSFAEIVALINSVDTTNDKAFAAYVLSNDAALAQEVKDREAGDSALDARLDILEGADTVSGSVAKAEKDAKSYADGIVSAEAATRQKADDALDARLDIIEGADSVEGSVAKAEKDAKDYADSLIATEQGVRDAEITAVEGRLDIIEGDVLTSGSMLFYKAEANAYTDSQVAILDARIDSLEGVAYQKESFTLVSGDVSNGYVELAFQAQPKSTTVFIDRLGATEDVDYTVSVVGGKTRLTWIGQLASGGASALVVGDKVHVKYGK